MKNSSEILAAVFGIYFITVVSGAILTASRTTAPWFGTDVSIATYSIFLIAALLLLIAIALFGAWHQRVVGTTHTLGVLAGPAVVAALYVGVAAIMLPTAVGFAQQNFQLNTAVILSMSYSWLGLAFYFAGAVGRVLRQKDRAVVLLSELNPAQVER